MELEYGGFLSTRAPYSIMIIDYSSLQRAVYKYPPAGSICRLLLKNNQSKSFDKGLCCSTKF